MHYPIRGTKWRDLLSGNVVTIETDTYSFRPTASQWARDNATFVEDFSEVKLCRVIPFDNGGHFCTSLRPSETYTNSRYAIQYIYSKDGIRLVDSELAERLQELLIDIPVFAYAALWDLGFSEFLNLITRPFTAWYDGAGQYHFSDSLDSHQLALLRLQYDSKIYHHVPKPQP